MLHPFQFVSQARRPTLLWIVLFLALAATAGMAWIGWPLRSAAAPLGLASLELAPDGVASAAIIDAWKQQHSGIRMDDALSTMVQSVPRGLDELATTVTILGYGYALVYCLALSMICVWRGSPGLGAALGWLIWVGGALDAVEHTLVLRMLLNDANGTLAETAHLLAWGKFAIVGLCLAYAVRTIWRR